MSAALGTVLRVRECKASGVGIPHCVDGCHLIALLCTTDLHAQLFPANEHSLGVSRGPSRDDSFADILEVMVLTPDAAYFASEIADRFDKSDQWARDRLTELDDRGLVERKDGGTRSTMWWPTDAGRQHVVSARDLSTSRDSADSGGA